MPRARSEEEAVGPMREVARDPRAVSAGPQPIVPPTPVFVSGFAASAWLQQQWPSPFPGDLLSVVLGWSLMVAGSLVFVWSVALFMRAQTGLLFHQPTRHLMTVGPYAWSRNPQYVGFAFIYVGAALLWGAWWHVCLLPPTILLVTFAVIRPEEKYLREEIGCQFDAYCRRVRRWI